MGLLTRLSDNTKSTSLANRLRKKRFRLFEDLVAPLNHPIRILDVGGTEDFWRTMDCTDPRKVEVTLVNIAPPTTTLVNFKSVYGDARDLSAFKDNEFDIAFSNSVIEHVGDYADQQKMAAGVMRVAKRYFVQTPNFYFPLEPHFLFPGFQFLPLQFACG